MNEKSTKNRNIVKGLFKYSLAAFVVFLIYWTLFPLSMGIKHPGITLLTGALIVLLIVILFEKQIRALEKGRLRLFIIICKIIAAILITGFIVLSVLMVIAASKTPPKNATVVVPGAQINGDTVSLILQCRLNEAVKYLNENPESPCIVSGGQGDNEICSEAEVMKTYLVNSGIEESRIYIEDQAVNTEQNLELSAKIIEENSLPIQTVIATDTFHEFRCAFEAKRNGLTPYAASCNTVWYLFPGYWVREMMAICKALIL